MYRIKIFILCFLLLTTAAYGKHSKKQEQPAFVPEYKYEPSPYVDPQVWHNVSQYFLPSNHPIKSRLDEIFSKTRVTLNPQTILEAGFERNNARHFSKTVVSKHPALNGYLVKMFTDEQDLEDYIPLCHRIVGAECVKAVIKVHHFEKFFKVPQKWIYPLPIEPSPPEGYHRKNFILVVEDMDIHHKQKNALSWKKKILPDRADAIYTVIQAVGLADSIYPFNLPFCRDGKQAFIDTEHHHKWPIHFDLMLPFFSTRMEHYWRIIVGNGGPLPN
jgi:hypothetical protein